MGFDQITYIAALGQANQLHVELLSGAAIYSARYVLDDIHEIRIAGGDCTHPRPADLTRVVCTVVYDSSGAGVESASSNDGESYTGDFRLRDGNDTVWFSNPEEYLLFTEFWLGPGNDRAFTRQAGDLMDAAAVYGQNGDDRIVAGSPDTLSLVKGGNGDDWISMCGPARIIDDEEIYQYLDNGLASGGNGNDRIYGRAGRQSLSGDAGDDLIDAGDGDDVLDGGEGDDRLWGRKGNDKIRGGNGDDVLYGGLGRDRLAGGTGKDLIVPR